MNKNIKLAVAGAVLALSASAANAGIVIPAGEWSLDVSGNVNAYANWYKSDGTATMTSAASTLNTGAGKNTTMNFGNGLLPNFLSVSGTTRQNDLDVGFTISLQPGTANRGVISEVSTSGNGGLNNRQAFITFGDKSWGTIKAGKDLGIFASDAILSDMTLLGVGALPAGGNTTLGRIGYGYIYADWKPQISYTTPNFSGFQATVGISQVQNGVSRTSDTTTTSLTTTGGSGAAPSYEGKASYSFAANGVDGKVFVSGIATKVGSMGSGVTNDDPVAYAGDIGANLSAAGFGLTGYYYGGQGIGTMGQLWDGFGGSAATKVHGRDSDGGYVQATYVLPTKTKVGVSWGVSNLDLADGEVATTAGTSFGNVKNLIKKNEMWTAGVYHPLTKHLNLVAEYSYMTSENQAGQENKGYSGNLGAILFF